MSTSTVIDVLDTHQRLKGLRAWQVRARTPGELARVRNWANAVEARLAELLQERDSLRRDLGRALLDLAEEAETNQRPRDEIDWLSSELEPRFVRIARSKPLPPAA